MKNILVLLPLFFLLTIVFGGCSNKINHGDNDFDIPVTLNECYVALDQLLDEDTKADIKIKNIDELIEYHFGLGMWIRNNWIYPADDKIAIVFLNAGITHPDEMSQEIITGYHYYLNDILYEIGQNRCTERNAMGNITWEGFLPSLLGVILGIVLTFGVNFLWRRREEKKRTKDILILVRNEMVNNKEMFKIQESLLRKDGEVYTKILEAENELTSIPADIIKTYHTQIQGITISPLNTTAWKIFQNSEMIQKMTDKEMVIRLTDCYAWMTGWHEFLTRDYWDTKKKMLLFELTDPYRFFETVMKNNEMLNFYESFRLDKDDIWETFLATDALIDYTIMLLDKHGDYKYDMEEKDNEINAYVQARLQQNKDVILKENE